MGVRITRHLQTSGRLMQALNGCAVYDLSISRVTNTTVHVEEDD